jgi:hypothetical protein
LLPESEVDGREGHPAVDYIAGRAWDSLLRAPRIHNVPDFFDDGVISWAEWMADMGKASSGTDVVLVDCFRHLAAAYPELRMSRSEVS